MNLLPVIAMSIVLGTLSQPIFADEIKSSQEKPATEVAVTENNDFIDPKVNIASRLGSTLDASPSVVTVITQEEIERSGARDMSDVMMLVPGFFPGLDTQGVVDFGVRGSWAHEGKMMVLLDGREYNENFYGTNEFGHHFPIQLIKRVEIIRGPGSALYGGYAELAVVNIITKTAKDLQGSFVGTQIGYTAKTYGRRDLSLGYGKTFDDGGFSLTGFIGQGQRSDRDYTDSQGSVVNLQHNSDLDPMMLNFDSYWKDLELKLVYDHYHTTSIDWYGTNLSTPLPMDFTSMLTHIRYKIHLSPQWTLTPEIRYRYMDAWQSNTTDPTSQNYFDYPSARVKYKLGSNYSFSDDLKFNFGVEYFTDAATNADTAQTSILPNGSNKVNYWTEAGFAEAFYRTELAEFTIGGRFEHNSFVGDNSAPRIAIVKPYEHWHWKLMAGKSFRTPAIANIASNQSIVAETTTSTEAEVGFKPSNWVAWSANIFDIQIEHPIIFSNTTNGTSVYNNGEKVGTRGLELEGRFAADWGETRSSYSYYQTSSHQELAYTVPQDDKVYLAFPSHKLALQSSVKLGSNDFRLTPSAVVYSARYAYTDNSATPSKINGTALLNLNLRKDNWLVRGLSGSVGIYNLTNQEFNIAQPYYNSGGTHPPLPTLSREVVGQLSYMY